jgi:transcriptional regulator with GAF, ATPase, and Fis domain
VLQEREFQRLGGTRVVRTDARIVAAKSKAAKELGLTRHQLYVRMRRHGLTD